MNTKSIMIFFGGMFSGAAAGILAVRTYYKKKYEKDYAALEEYYRGVDKYARQDHKEEEEEGDDGINSPETNPGGRMTPEERKEIKEKLKRNWEGTTNYAGMYRTKDGHTEQKLAEAQHPLDQGEPGETDPSDIEPVCVNCAYFDPEEGYCTVSEEHVNDDDSCSDFKEIVETPEEEAFEDHQKNKNRPPKIISDEAYGELPAHIDKEVLYFFAQDEMLTDDNEEPVEEPERLVGDALTKYGFNESDEMIIFVMNYNLDTCYEIQKLDSSWTDTH